MINTVYRLIAPKSIRADFVDLKLDEERIIIRPTYLSICAADQRYYTGSRGRVVMKQKLPMAIRMVVRELGEAAVKKTLEDFAKRTSPETPNKN